MKVHGTSVSRRKVLKASASILASTVALPNLGWAQTPKNGGILRVSNGGDPPHFDMHQTATYLTEFIGAPCYSTLLRIHPNDINKLVPDLAEKYEYSDDRKSVTFTLRQGVQFHNGMPLTAEDVVFSLDRIRKPPKGLVSPRKGLLGNIKDIEVKDARTVVVHLNQPQLDFPFLISNPYNVIYPRKVTQPLDAEGKGMKREIIGTGAFKLTQAVDGQIYELERFDKYFGKPAHLDKIQFFPIKGEVERSAALQGKRIDACFFFPNEAVLQTLRKVPGITALRRPTPTFINLIPNVRRKPYDDVRVREALSLAVDRAAFIKTVGPLAGAFFHSMGLMPPGSPYSLSKEQMKQFGGYDTMPDMGGNIDANRKRAVELLEQAGVPKGFKVVLLARADIPAFRDSAINLAAQFKNVGIDATVDSRDAGAFYAAESAGDFEVVVHSIAVSGSLPDHILGEGYTSYGGRNYGGWKDDSIDNLFRQQSAAADPKKRDQLVEQFQLAFLKTYYHINLAWVGYGAAYSNALKGWNALPDLYANMQLDNVWLES